jgi:hypothetical protein
MSAKDIRCYNSRRCKRMLHSPKPQVTLAEAMTRPG